MSARHIFVRAFIESRYVSAHEADERGESVDGDRMFIGHVGEDREVRSAARDAVVMLLRRRERDGRCP